MLPEQERQAILSSLTNEQYEELRWDWKFWAHPHQLPPPGDWLVWLLMAGRGYGKTRAGAEFIRQEVQLGHAKRVALVAKTPADARDVMVEGDSGILAISPPIGRPEYEPSKRRLTWPNGTIGLIFSSEVPDQLRGPQFDLAWGDEIRTWNYAQDTWDNLMLGLRLGDHPRVVATTTPSPISLIRTLLASPTTVITKGTTYENRANLAPSFFSQIVSRYAGTRLGRQEIEAELLEDVPGALWQRAMIDQYRVTANPDLVRVVVGVDPPGGATECGIVVVGDAGDGHYYVLDDRSLQDSPDKWAEAVLTGYNRNRADAIVGEANFGGDMVENTIKQAARTRNLVYRYKAVQASRGKAVRAEPIVALYEQGRVHHVGNFSALEDEMTEWVPGESNSPNRVDALVWALTELTSVRRWLPV